MSFKKGKKIIYLPKIHSIIVYLKYIHRNASDDKPSPFKSILSKYLITLWSGHYYHLWNKSPPNQNQNHNGKQRSFIF